MTQITGHRFVLAVHDLKKSAAFYQDVLGFDVHEVDPGWVFLNRDGCMIMMGECPDALAADALGDHSYFAYLEVTGIDELYKKIGEKGNYCLATPEDRPWGMREFHMRTIDGHRIMVGEIISDR